MWSGGACTVGGVYGPGGLHGLGAYIVWAVCS